MVVAIVTFENFKGENKTLGMQSIGIINARPNYTAKPKKTPLPTRHGPKKLPEILAVKNGAWSYEQVMTFAKDMQIKLDNAYKTTNLPKSVDFDKVNKLYHELFEGYHRNPHLNSLYGNWAGL